MPFFIHSKLTLHIESNPQQTHSPLSRAVKDILRTMKVYFNLPVMIFINTQKRNIFKDVVIISKTVLFLFAISFEKKTTHVLHL